jgi:Fic family protein
MNFSQFVAGKYTQQYEYKSFSPTPINHEWVWDDARINSLLEEASFALASLNAFSRIVPDIDRFIYMHILKEANTSSRIEGTRTEMNDILHAKEEVMMEKRDDWQEVQNFVKAMNYSVAKLNELPLSSRLLRDAHSLLLEGARGEHKTPGEFRKSQNWIGGASIKDAVFIPPHEEELPALMSDLEKFWHNEQIQVPHLIRIALSHYQFETIHPFLDGNGRIGRLLITLYLLSKGLLSRPCLYLSAYIERHKGQYYDALTTVRESNDMGHWVRFFLLAIRETARRGVETFLRLMEFRDEMQRVVMKFGPRTQIGLSLLDVLYQKVVMDGAETAKALDVSRPTAAAILSKFVDAGILEEVTGFRRNRQYFFGKYYEIFQD